MRIHTVKEFITYVPLYINQHLTTTYSSFLFLALRHEPFFALIERDRDSYSDSVIRFNGNDNTFEAKS